MNLQDWTNIATISGIVLALCQFYCSRRDNKNNNEQKNGPDFYFTAPRQCNRFGVGYCSGGDFTPELLEDCSGANLIYLFNLVNCGKFAAKEVKYCITTESEAKDILSINDERWTTIKHHSGFPSGEQSGDMHQILAKKGAFDIRADDKCFYILLEYKSSYTNKKYKRIYECCIKDFVEESLTSYYDKEAAKYRIYTHDLELKSTLSDKAIISAVRKKITKQAKDYNELFEKMGLRRVVSIHDIKLIDECHAILKNSIKRLSAKIRKKITKSQKIEDWLLDL